VFGVSFCFSLTTFHRKEKKRKEKKRKRKEKKRNSAPLKNEYSTYKARNL
jgi:hypothetical protein